MKSAGSTTDLPATADKRFSSSSPSPNRFRFFSSASSNESSDSTSSAAAVAAARKRLLHILNHRSFSSSTRGSSPSPLAPMENLQALRSSIRSSPAYPVYKTPVKVEVQEDVLVMDAISESMPGTGRARHPLKIISSSSSSSSSINNYSSKTEMCQSWEEYGFCRFGSRCQLAHGKEELRGGGSRPWKLKPESGRHCSTIGSSGYDDKYLRYTSPAVMVSLLRNYEAAASTCAALQVMEIVAPTGDGFSWPPTETQEVEIQRVLYGPRQSGNRLPVFVKICSVPDPQV